jgi:hypothetical protein
MKTLLAFAFAFTLVSNLPAADLLPELTSFATKHESESEILKMQKTAAVTRMRQPYLAALDSAEHSATNAGNLPTVAAITRERTALQDGGLEGAFPNDLPRTLQSPRKSCMDGVLRIETSYVTNQQRIDADYLKALASLQPRAANNPALAAQITAEKTRLLENIKTAPKLGAVARETMEKEVLGRWYWGDTTKLWVLLSEDGKAYLHTRKMTWTVNSDGSITFTDLNSPRSKSICFFDLKKNTFTGTDFDGKSVKGVLYQKKRDIPK